MKEKFLWIGLIVIVLSWGGNYIYFQSKQIKQPIFLDHYYEAYLQEEVNLTFYYLSNKTDTSNIMHVSIDGIEAYPESNDGFMWDTNVPKYEQEFSHQYLKSVRLQLPKHLVPLEEGTEDIWTFNEITFMFSNGESLTTNIGKVNVYAKQPDYEVLETRISGSSNQHRSQVAMITTSPLTIDAISIPFSEQLSEEVDVKVDINQEKLAKLDILKNGGPPPEWFEREQNLAWDELKGESYSNLDYPIQLNQHEWIQLFMQFKADRTSYFEFGIAISGTTENGKPFIHKAPIIDPPYLTQQEVNEIIQRKQGGKN